MPHDVNVIAGWFPNLSCLTSIPHLHIYNFQVQADTSYTCIQSPQTFQTGPGGTKLSGGTRLTCSRTTV